MTAGADWRQPASWPDILRDAMQSLPTATRWWVGLSGGLDSIFLLHVARAWIRYQGLPVALHAVHVNHQLSARSPVWQAFCEKTCAGLDVPLVSEAVLIAPEGVGVEAEARRLRYQVFQRLLGTGDLLLLAHHADDQAETLLYRLMRGSGVRGLAAMPAQRRLGEGRLMRPLLTLSRAFIETQAQAWGLVWHDDESNLDVGFDRNFLRHRVLPVLGERWPHVVDSLSQVAEACGEADALLGELAEIDADSACHADGQLLCAPLASLSTRRQMNLMRYWLRKQGVQPPGRQRLLAGVAMLLQAGEDRQPALEWPGWSVRRYRGALYLVRRIAEAPEAREWDLRQALSWAGGRLFVKGVDGEGLRSDVDRVRVSLRRGGEHLDVDGRGSRRPLKKWLQDQGVPPWLRTRLPLLWWRDELVAVGDLWVHPGYRAAAGEAGLKVIWQP